jgi:hypothetical protein
VEKYQSKEDDAKEKAIIAQEAEMVKQMFGLTKEVEARLAAKEAADNARDAKQIRKAFGNMTEEDKAEEAAQNAEAAEKLKRLFGASRE